MGIARHRFNLELKTEAAHLVIDTGRTITEVAAELSVVDSPLARWVRNERRQIEMVAESAEKPPGSAERIELVRLRRQVTEQEKDLAFLGKAAASFASNPPKQRIFR